MARLGTMLLCLATLAACAGPGAAPDPDGPVLHETTLTRFDGSAISLEELAATRASAVAAAETIARIERSLREPGAEEREAAQIIADITSSHAAETRLARTLWESAEPRGPGNDRQAFREFGFYSNQMDSMAFSPRARPDTLEEFVELLLRQHDDTSDQVRLLAAWRRFAPLVADRRPAFLAASWEFELDYIRPLRAGLSESLLGPHMRCSTGEADGVSFGGRRESYEGYQAPVLLLDLLLPGPDSPVGKLIDELSRLADGQPVDLSFRIADGHRDASDELERRFLQACLHGLQDGFAELESLPAGAKRLNVTFSYLVERGEARACLALRRKGGSWELELFEYEPAAASLLGSDARLDLLPGIRNLVHGSRRE